MSEVKGVPHVLVAIHEVQAALCKQGIAKDRKPTDGLIKYSYRGIDDVYEALAPLLAEHKLIILPRCVSRDWREATSTKGNILNYTSVDVEFDFYSVVDGSKVVAKLPGEAMDSGDKATNKSLSAAYKYMAFMSFAIPTDGSGDSENETHEIAYTRQPTRIDDTDLREQILQASQECGFPGAMIWSTPLGKRAETNNDLIVLLGKLRRGELKGPEAK